MWVRYEGKTKEGGTVSIRLPLILALRGHEPVLPGVLSGTIRASIEEEGKAKVGEKEEQQ